MCLNYRSSLLHVPIYSEGLRTTGASVARCPFSPSRAMHHTSALSTSAHDIAEHLTMEAKRLGVEMLHLYSACGHLLSLASNPAARPASSTSPSCAPHLLSLARLAGLTPLWSLLPRAGQQPRLEWVTVVQLRCQGAITYARGQRALSDGREKRRSSRT